MRQIGVKFQSKKDSGSSFSAWGGVVLFEELFRKFGIGHAIDEHIGARKAGSGVMYTDSTYVKNIVLMQLLGGETVDDLRLLREDPALREFIGEIPGRTSFHKYLSSFVDEAEERKRGRGKSVLLEPNEHLKGFDEVTRHILSSVPSFRRIHTVTLDQDATFIPTGVSGALYNYKSERSFSALGSYCPEYDMTIRSEYRDGNVTPGYCQLAQLRASLELLPEAVRRVRLRSDTAGYQVEVLEYCAKGKDERFGVIEFAIGCPVTSALKEAATAVKEKEWRRLPGNPRRECAIIPFAPGSLSSSKNGPEYRFIAIREAMCDADDTAEAQRLLFPDDENSGVASLHPTFMNGRVYKVFGLVTNNLGVPPEETVRWYYARCGKSEEIHRILKNELAGGHVVTSALGANSAWWQMAVLSANLLSLIKTVCLPEAYRGSRPKKLRCCLFAAVARVIRHARRRWLVICDSFSAALLKGAWNRLAKCELQTE